jgi:hypothetical protein
MANEHQLTLYYQEKVKLLDYQASENNLQVQIVQLKQKLLDSGDKPVEYQQALQAQIDQLTKSSELGKQRIKEQEIQVYRLSMDENGQSIVNVTTDEPVSNTPPTTSSIDPTISSPAVTSDSKAMMGTSEDNEEEDEEEDSPTEGNRLKNESRRYGFIFGGDLVISYFRLYSSNLDRLNKFKVADNTDVDVQPSDNIVVRVGAPLSIPINAAQTKDPDESGEEPDPDVKEDPKATYSQAKEPSAVAKEAANEAKKVIGEDGAKALLAHSNTKTFFQRFWPLSGETKDAIAVGVGIFGIADKVLKQSSNTPKPTFVPANVTRTPSNPSATVLSYKQNLKASNDPRLDPVQSGKIAATLSSELAQSLGVSPRDLHPDIHAYVLQLGPKDPVLLAALKEVNPTDQTQTTGQKLAQVIKRRMVVHGGYSKAEIGYVDNYRSIKEMADTKGLHSLN